MIVSPAGVAKLLACPPTPRQRRPTIDPRLRDALREGLVLGPETRLLAFGTAALEPGDARAVAHLAVCADAGWPGSPSCAVAVDPLRLPFVEALFDVAIVAGALEASDAPAALLRELRRVLAPAATLWLVAPRQRLSLGHGEPGRHFARARLDRLLVEAMLEPVDWATFGGCYLIRAEPRGGVAGQRPVAAGALRPARV